MKTLNKEAGGFDMKRHNWTLIGATLFLALFLVNVNAQALDKEALKAEIKEELKEEMKHGGGLLAEIVDRVHISGLIELGWVVQDIDHRPGEGQEKPRDYSDIALTTVEIAMEAEVNEWVNAEVVLLYETPTFEGGGPLDVDVATVTIGNTEEFPLYLTAGVMYVPFGALLTHFPDDPLIDVPLALAMGETREDAALLGIEYQGFSLSAYAFNGDAELREHNNQVETYGFDGNFSYDDEEGLDVLAGASWISNIAETDGLEGLVVEFDERVEGFDGYFHIGLFGFFVDAEYMTALSTFTVNELTQGNKKAAPEVWNLEFGYNLDWGKNLEIALKCAGSAEAEALGYPEKRYGIALNQEIFEGVIFSVASLYDDYEKRRDANGRDDRKTVYGQIAVEF
jgi:hypothetical protein